MARAKSTARAEARRRYRASQGVTDDTDSGAEAAPGGVAAAEPRRGMLGFAMPDWRGDLRAFPHELRTNRWWWICAVLLLSGAVAGVLKDRFGTEAGGVMQIYYQLMVQPPVAIPILVAGFMSRRGPYLIGLLLGLLDGIVFVGVALYEISGVGLPAGVTQDQVMASSASTILSTAFLGAAFAWITFIYKGWLQNSSRRRIEQRERQAQEQKRKARDEARQARSGR